MTIYLEPDVEVLRFGNFIGSDQPRADRAEGVSTLAFHPLARTLELKGAFGKIVNYAVPGDMRKRVGFFHILRGLADDHAEFDLPVHLRRSARHDHIIVGAA